MVKFVQKSESGQFDRRGRFGVNVWLSNVQYSFKVPEGLRIFEKMYSFRRWNFEAVITILVLLYSLVLVIQGL
jgi:hypothetical protein